MAHLHLEDPSDEMTCPYDDTHRVRVSRFQYHLIKCGKNHPHMQLMKCPFNARHYLQKHQYQQHVATCPDSALVQRDIMYSNAANKLVADKTSGNCSLPQNTYSTEYSSGENWDDDPDPNATSFVFGRSRVNPTPDTAMPPLAPSMPTMPKKVVPSSIGIGRGRGIPMNAAAAKAPGESRRVNAPSLALFDVGISEPAGSANQQPAARVSSSQVSPAVRMPANQPLTAASTNQQAGGAPLRAPPGFENKVPNTHIANNVVKQKTGRTPMAQCITPFGIAKDSVNVDSRQSGGSTGMSSGSEATFSDDLDDGSADVGLQLRKLKKKLRQIEDLEAKQTHGMYLDREQLRKLDTKDELITMMANLELQSLDFYSAVA